MAIGAIGFFGRGDLMRQRMYWNAQRNPPMPMSSFAQGQVVDVGVMPGTVEPPASGETPAVPAVSGYGSFSGWGNVTSGQVLSTIAAAPLGPVGIALALKKNNQSIAHARKQVAHWKKVYMRVQMKGKKDKRVQMAKMKYEHWKRVLAALTRKKAMLQKARSHRKWEKRFTKRAKRAVRKGQQIPMTPAQRRALRASLDARKTTTLTRGLQTGAEVSSSALSTSVPPGQYDYMTATALPTTATSNAVAPTSLVGQRAQDVDINDDGIRDDIGPDGQPIAADGADAEGAMAADGSEGGIMTKLSDTWDGIPTWAKIGGGVAIALAIFSRTPQGKRFLAKLKRKGGGGSAE